MRRLLSIGLAFVLLTPWIAALNGAAVSVVACPMHRSGEAAGHGQASHATAGLADHRASTEAEHPHHGTTARGCNCAGECGRSGASFKLPDNELVTAALYGTFEVSLSRESPVFTSAFSTIPFATGPPQRLRV